MKKKLVILGIVVLLSTIGLSGCNEIGITNQLKGTWVGHVSIKEQMGSVDAYITELTFTDDEVYTEIGVMNGDPFNVIGTYETQGNTLLIQYPTGLGLSFTYEIETVTGTYGDERTRLILDDGKGYFWKGET